MAQLNATTSCGIRELHGLGNTDESLRAALNGKGWYAHLWFSDNMVNGNGRRLCDTILQFGLGPVAESVAQRNPQSGNAIVGWVWTPDYTAVTAFLAGKLKPYTPAAIAAKGAARSGKRKAAARR